MPLPSLPTSARLRRSLARRRVRELSREHPVLEWLYGRLIVTETALSDVTREHPVHGHARDRVLRGNGYVARTAAASVVLEAQLAALSEAPGDAPAQLDKPTVLLALPDPLLLRAFRRVLERRYHVLVTTRASEALALLAEQSVQVVVTDQDLEAAFEGVRLLERAKANFPGAGRILLSEQVSADAAGSGESIEHWIHKGAPIEVLLDRIARSLLRG